jgi:uncharacterized protein YggE
VIRTLIGMLVLSSASVALAQTAAPPITEPPVVVTSGEGSVKRAPDQAWVTLAVESRAKTSREAQRLNADAMAAVMAKLKGMLPADAVRTIAYDLQPEFDYANGRQTLRGYVARNALDVRVDDLPKLGEVLDAGVGAGATSVNNIRFDLKDRASAEREALQKAVEDARARATAAATGAGMKIDRIVRIEEQRAEIPPPPRPIMTMRAEAAPAQATQVVAGELEIKSTVTLTAAIR